MYIDIFWPDIQVPEIPRKCKPVAAGQLSRNQADHFLTYTNWSNSEANSSLTRPSSPTTKNPSKRDRNAAAYWDGAADGVTGSIL
jgi:hypothetical protein